VRLKIFTTAALLLGFGLLVSWPWTLGPRPPKGAPRAEFTAYSRRAAIYLGGLLLSVTSSGVGALLIMRQVKEDYRRQSIRNMEGLVESTREDHMRKQSDGHDG